MSYSEIDAASLHARLDAEPPSVKPIDGYIVIDVERNDRYMQEHIPGSINIPAGSKEEITRHFGRLKEIVLYCGTGSCKAAKDVAKYLAKQGYANVSVFDGSVKEWRRSGLPVEHNRGPGRSLPQGHTIPGGRT